MRINDQIFQIGETNVRSMSSEQVASVLRQSSMYGQVIKFIVARPVHNNVTDIDLINLQDDNDSENFKTLLNSMNGSSNQNTFLFKTNEIMDKNLNLTKKLESEGEKRERAQQPPIGKEIFLDVANKPSPDTISDIIDADSLKEIAHEDSINEDNHDKMKLPVKTSTPIRQIPGNIETSISISKNTALVESIIEKDQLDKSENTNLNKSNISETNDKKSIDNEKTLVLEPETAETDLSKEDTHLVNLTKNLKNSKLTDSERQKQIQTILLKRSDEEEIISNEHLILEACNVFLRENFSLTIGCEEWSTLDDKKREKCYYVNEKLNANSSSEDYSSVQIYEQIIEIESKGIEEFLSKTDFANLDLSSINIKLVKNIDLKFLKMKQKWKQHLEANNYLYDDFVSDFFKIFTELLYLNGLS